MSEENQRNLKTAFLKRSVSLKKLRIIADYQFGKKAGVALFPNNLEFKRSKSGRISQIFYKGDRLASLKINGMLTLGEEGGKRLHSKFDPPKLRVQFGEESVNFLREGKSGFAKFVQKVDSDIRSKEEVLVVGPEDELIGIGKATLCCQEMKDFNTGVAVKMRESIEN